MVSRRHTLHHYLCSQQSALDDGFQFGRSTLGSGAATLIQAAEVRCNCDQSALEHQRSISSRIRPDIPSVDPSCVIEGDPILGRVSWKDRGGSSPRPIVVTTSAARTVSSVQGLANWLPMLIASFSHCSRLPWCRPRWPGSAPTDQHVQGRVAGRAFEECGGGRQPQALCVCADGHDSLPVADPALPLWRRARPPLPGASLGHGSKGFVDRRPCCTSGS